MLPSKASSEKLRLCELSLCLEDSVFSTLFLFLALALLRTKPVGSMLCLLLDPMAVFTLVSYLPFCTYLTIL